VVNLISLNLTEGVVLMKIELENYRENEDGSADFNVYLDEAAKEFLLRYALIACITDAIEAGKKATPTTEETE
jgi:hypothetical protein